MISMEYQSGESAYVLVQGQWAIKLIFNIVISLTRALIYYAQPETSVYSGVSRGGAQGARAPP